MDDEKGSAYDLVPSFVKRLVFNDSVNNVLMVGCGGGFDFVHSMLLYPMLKAAGKNIVLGSNSFGDVGRIDNEEEIVFDKPIVKRVNGESIGSKKYCPEVALTRFLDLKYDFVD